MLRAVIRLLGRGRLDPAQLALPFGEPPEPVRPDPRPQSVVDVPPPPTSVSKRSRDESALARLVARHAELNATRFGGELQPIRIELSGRMRSRLGYYRLATPRAPGLIVISRRHLRRHGWNEAFETLLHEMVHQWQNEQRLPVDHGRAFRRKAKAVGCVPRAKRLVR